MQAPKAAAADDALAERLGMGDLAALRAALKTPSSRSQYQGASRFKLKRALLDALDTRHDIALPPRMVEAEFEGIWRQVLSDQAEGGLSPEDEGKSRRDQLQAEYRKIAERRVRLGLVLAEIGRRENVTVTDDELADAMRAEAMRYGAQAQQVFDLLRQNPNAQAQMRAPIYEEKVVDLIIGRATVTDKAVSKEELLKEDDLPEAYGDPPAAPSRRRPQRRRRPRPAERPSRAKAGQPPKPRRRSPAKAAPPRPKAREGPRPRSRAPAKAAKPAPQGRGLKAKRLSSAKGPPSTRRPGRPAAGQPATRYRRLPAAAPAPAQFIEKVPSHARPFPRPSTSCPWWSSSPAAASAPSTSSRACCASG